MTAQTLEVIALTVEDAMEAQSGGAHTLELVQNLAAGGLTPNFEMIRAIREAVTIPLHVIIRPHADSFVYSEADAEQCVRAAEFCGRSGIERVVFGALKPDLTLDLTFIRRVAVAALPATLSMHRAIDHTPEPSAALESLIGIADRVLCSGAAESAWDGRDTLKQWVNAYGDRLRFAVAGGVTLDNIGLLARLSGAHELHVGGAARSGVSPGQVDRAKVRALVQALG